MLLRILIVVVTLIAGGGIYYLAFQAPKPVDPPAEDERTAQNQNMVESITGTGQAGDWLVSRGYKFTDQLVATATNTPISHVGVYDKERNLVIEADGAGGVHEKPLADFVNKSHRVILIRPMWAKGQAPQQAIEAARKLVGKKYDFLGTVGLNVSERFYCSELAVYIYKPFMSGKEKLPLTMEPGQLYLWGSVLWDSRPRHEM
jgi:hypothetical protein